MMKTVLRLLYILLLAVPAFAAEWVEYRSGPFHVFSDAGDRAARERLTQLEQLRHVLGAQLGKDGMSRAGQAQELTTVWPLHLVLFAKQAEYTPHVLAKPVADGGGAEISTWTADTGKNTSLPPDLLRAFAKVLIEDNAGRMPEEIETALADLLSTIEVSGTRVRIGAPVEGLSGARQRNWAKLQMMATQPAYTGKLRVYLNNLQNASDEDTASRNSFEMTAAKLGAAVDAYTKAGKFEAAAVDGRALNPNRDFIEKNLTKAQADELLAELGGTSFAAGSPRGLLAQNTMPALDLAIRANPRWAEPHVKMAALETDPARKIAHWKLAASLAPRNASYWQSLAELQASARLFSDAEKSWAAGERASANPVEKARIHQAKLSLEDQRAEAIMAERQRARDEEARDLQNVKDGAAEEVRAAERAANERLRGFRGDTPVPATVVPLSSLAGETQGEKVAGTLTRVECLNGPLRLSIQREDSGIVIRLLIRDARKINVALDSGEAVFACGAQKPARKIEVQYKANADAKTSTLGEILLVKFPE